MGGLIPPPSYASLAGATSNRGLENRKSGQKGRKSGAAQRYVSQSLLIAMCSKTHEEKCGSHLLIMGELAPLKSWASLAGAASKRVLESRKSGLKGRNRWFLLRYVSQVLLVGIWSDSAETKCEAQLLVMGEVSPPKSGLSRGTSALGWPISVSTSGMAGNAMSLSGGTRAGWLAARSRVVHGGLGGMHGGGGGGGIPPIPMYMP